MAVKTKKNAVNPLNWQIPIVNPDGTPTDEFMRKWAQQATANASIPDLSSAALVSALLDVIGLAQGDLLYRDATQWKVLAPGTANSLLRTAGAGANPSWLTVSAALDTIGSARGSVIYRGASGWAILPPGTTGQVLTAHGAGADPTWVSSAAGAAPSSLFLNGTNGFVGMADSNGLLIVDSHGFGTYDKDPVLPQAMLPNGNAVQKGIVQIDGATLILSSGVIQTPGSANASATARDTAVVGTATTFMRSDGAPAVGKAVAGAFGLVKPDGTTLTLVAGLGSAMQAQLAPVFFTSGGLAGCASQSLTTAGFTQYTTEFGGTPPIDTAAGWDATNHQYVVPVSGVYLLWAQAINFWSGAIANPGFTAGIFKNGLAGTTLAELGAFSSSPSASTVNELGGVFAMAKLVAGDTIQFATLPVASGGFTMSTGDDSRNFLALARISP